MGGGDARRSGGKEGVGEYEYDSKRKNIAPLFQNHGT